MDVFPSPGVDNFITKTKHNRRLLVAATMLLALAAPPAARAQQRVIALGGAVTEIVYALHAQDRLVATDTSSTYPREATTLPNVGYMRRLGAEPIVALHPDLILALQGSGPQNVMTQLHDAGVRTVDIPDPPGLGGMEAKIHAVADALGETAAGDALARQVQAQADREVVRYDHVSFRPRVLTLLSAGKGAALAAGDDTAAASIVALAGGTNAVSGFTGYKPLSAEIIAAARPEIVLVPSFALEGLGGARGILERPEFADSPVAGTKRVITLDALLLLGFGPRTPQAIAALGAALHPEIVDNR